MENLVERGCVIGRRLRHFADGDVGADGRIPVLQVKTVATLMALIMILQISVRNQIQSRAWAVVPWVQAGSRMGSGLNLLHDGDGPMIASSSVREIAPGRSNVGLGSASESTVDSIPT